MNVLLVGAGPVGYEKATAILKNAPSTKLRIVATQVSEEVASLKQHYSTVEIDQKAFSPDDLAGVHVLFLAVNNIALSAEIRTMARGRNILVNVADTPELCDFYMSSIVQKGNLKVAISTNGKSPTIAKRLRELLEECLPEELDELLDNMTKLRSTLRGDFAEKVRVLNEVTSSLKKK